MDHSGSGESLQCHRYNWLGQRRALPSGTCCKPRPPELSITLLRLLSAIFLHSLSFSLISRTSPIELLAMSCSAQGVHFVGSLPVDNIESAFTTVATTLPQHVLRCPDGEPGERANFTAFQYFKFPEAMRKPFIPDTTSAASDHNILSDTEVRDQLKDLVTEYDRVAISSYAIFTRLKEDGTIPKHIKFQVCFPTPTCVISGVRRPYQPLAEELYRSALLRALQNVQDHIPHHELAIQIDCKSDPCLFHSVLVSTDLLSLLVW